MTYNRSPFCDICHRTNHWTRECFYRENQASIPDRLRFASNNRNCGNSRASFSFQRRGNFHVAPRYPRHNPNAARPLNFQGGRQ